LSLGAVDYVTKPVALPIVQARVATHLRLRDARDMLQSQNLHLESLVRERTRSLEAKSLELQRNQDLTIFALGSICETRDNETGNHIHRTSAYVEILAARLAKLPQYQNTIAPDEWEMIWKSAPLHDIGKVGIPDHILLKPGRLTAEEFAVMKQHPTLGRDAIRMAETRIHARDTFLRVATDIVYGHHEHWNGNGYPEGVSGEAIPLAARMMAVADVYDALISKRVYKPAMSHAEASAIIQKDRGTQFDPTIVDCFLADGSAFQAAAARYQD
jgi:putative two-component system response regulator